MHVLAESDRRGAPTPSHKKLDVEHQDSRNAGKLIEFRDGLPNLQVVGHRAMASLEGAMGFGVVPIARNIWPNRLGSGGWVTDGLGGLLHVSCRYPVR